MSAASAQFPPDLNRRTIELARDHLRAARAAPADRPSIDMADVDIAIAALDAILGDPIIEAMIDLRPGEPFFLMRGRDAYASAAIRWYVRERVWKEGLALETTLAHELAEKMDAYRALPVVQRAPALFDGAPA